MSSTTCRCQVGGGCTRWSLSVCLAPGWSIPPISSEQQGSKQGGICESADHKQSHSHLLTTSRGRSEISHVSLLICRRFLTLNDMF